MTKVDIAREAWGADVPDWIIALAEACDASSQNKVAKQIGRSASLVSTVLTNSYAGNMEAVEDVVRGALMSEKVACPHLGEIGTQKCRAWRSRPFSNRNTLSIQMYRACKVCPRNVDKKEAEDADT
ncbi:hypothetical protein [Tropicibacter sp. S64]|uniref:hypothetical protein n=1 Tax=Tropicibacter sp. S64 TaxID=3415122 RepID=UPI003C7B6D95